MRGLLFGFLVVVTLVFGASYASAILFSFMGPFSAVGIEQDGSADAHGVRAEPAAARMGAGLSRRVDRAGEQGHRGARAIRLPLARACNARLARRGEALLHRALTASGFTVDDLGIAPLNPATARMLGMDGTISAKRDATDDIIYVQIRTPDGLIPSRMLQIRWAKISEYPQHAAAIAIRHPVRAGRGALGSGIAPSDVQAPRRARCNSHWLARFALPALQVKAIDKPVKFIDLTARQNMLGRRRNVPA